MCKFNMFITAVCVLFLIKLRRLHQISLPLIARFEKFSSYTCEVHPNFAYAEAYKYYLLSAVSSEASEFFLIFCRIKREPESIKKAVFES